MIRRTLILLLLAVAASAQPEPQADLPWTTLPGAFADAAATDRPIVVYAHADWCAPCHRIEQTTFAAAAVRARFERFVLARLDLDDRDSKQQVGPYRLSPAAWAGRLGVEAPPSLVLLAPDGAVLGRVTGFLEPDALLPILDAALSDAQS
ncbi:MAG: thioredoxin family protein [Bacteroidota bacterium]